MKLVRFGPPGREKPGIVDAKGRIRDLSKIVPDIAGEALSPKGLAKIKKAADRQAAAGEGQSAARPLRRQGRQFHRDRAQLFRPRRRSRHADPEGADHLQQGAVLHLRAERRHHHPEGFHQARLGSGARHRHRPARALSQQGQGARRGRRLLPRQRRVGARVPDRARRPMDQGQGLRDLRAARALARHQGRDQGSAEASTCGSTSTARSASAATPRP